MLVAARGIFSVPCSRRDLLLWHVGSSSLTRDQTPAPCSHGVSATRPQEVPLPVISSLLKIGTPLELLLEDTRGIIYSHFPILQMQDPFKLKSEWLSSTSDQGLLDN